MCVGPRPSPFGTDTSPVNRTYLWRGFIRSTSLTLLRMTVMFWILPALIIPSIVLLVSLLYTLFPPRKINSLYGYRTPRSMLNQDTWAVANQLAPKALITVQIGIGVLIVLVGVLHKYEIVSIFNNEDSFYLASMVLATASVTSVFFIVEKNLTKLFNDDGTRKTVKT
jgi:hypothetical protein